MSDDDVYDEDFDQLSDGELDKTGDSVTPADAANGFVTPRTHPSATHPLTPSQGGGKTPNRSRVKRGEWKRGKLIGKGAFGKVYQGLHTRTGKFIAVKEFVYTSADLKQVAELREDYSDGIE